MNCIKDGKYTGDSCFGCNVKVEDCEIMDKVYRNRWIPVSEKLPGEEKYYNVTVKTEYGTWCEFCLFEKSTNKFYIVADGNTSDKQSWKEVMNNVTAWMPLPEPYKVK